MNYFEIKLPNEKKQIEVKNMTDDVQNHLTWENIILKPMY